MPRRRGCIIPRLPGMHRSNKNDRSIHRQHCESSTAAAHSARRRLVSRAVAGVALGRGPRVDAEGGHSMSCASASSPGARMEPSEGHYELDWLDRAIAAPAKHHICVVIGTPTDAPPAWLTPKYPRRCASMRTATAPNTAAAGSSTAPARNTASLRGTSPSKWPSASATTPMSSAGKSATNIPRSPSIRERSRQFQDWLQAALRHARRAERPGRPPTGARPTIAGMRFRMPTERRQSRPAARSSSASSATPGATSSRSRSTSFASTPTRASSSPPTSAAWVERRLRPLRNHAAISTSPPGTTTSAKGT